jgi:hypothetical protein
MRREASDTPQGRSQTWTRDAECRRALHLDAAEMDSLEAVNKTCERNKDGTPPDKRFLRLKPIPDYPIFPNFFACLEGCMFPWLSIIATCSEPVQNLSKTQS